MIEDSRCVICEAGFRPEAMVGNKCSSCAKLYPDAKSKEDIKPERKQGPRTMTEEVVRDMIYEVLEEAGIKRIICEKCGKKVFRSGPAQKFCQDCKDKESK